MVEDMLVERNRFLAIFGNLLLCAVIGLIVGVCSIQWGNGNGLSRTNRGKR